MLQPVIIAGGSGVRLWPLSRQSMPKQFLSLTKKNMTMLQQTIQRLNGIEHYSPLVICNEDHRFIVAEQLRQCNESNPYILLEPFSRDTAPAIALAALALEADGKDPVMLVLAADHSIDNISSFHSAIIVATNHAMQGKLVTFGTKPTRAETGYGYILKAEPLQPGSYSIESFIEKPDLKQVQGYFESGKYLWNSGMFMFLASVYLEELEKFSPDILSACRAALSDSTQDMYFKRVNRSLFSPCPTLSIDYAIMERSYNKVVVELDAGWNDIGSWSSLWEISKKDQNGNVLNGDVVIYDTEDSLLHSEYRLIATLGVKNLVVIETKDAILVADKNQVQDVKQLVDLIKQSDRSEHIVHREVYRPWGVYDTVDIGIRYQVKHITVNPGGKLSLQMHHHRAEHWIVVSGTAKVTRGEETFLVTENQSTYIPIGQNHSLENPGVIPLELIEVQSGAYLGEDDIVRFHDLYGRVEPQ